MIKTVRLHWGTRAFRTAISNCFRAEGTEVIKSTRRIQRILETLLRTNVRNSSVNKTSGNSLPSELDGKAGAHRSQLATWLQSLSLTSSLVQLGVRRLTSSLKSRTAFEIIDHAISRRVGHPPLSRERINGRKHWTESSYDRSPILLASSAEVDTCARKRRNTIEESCWEASPDFPVAIQEET